MSFVVSDFKTNARTLSTSTSNNPLKQNSLSLTVAPKELLSDEELSILVKMLRTPVGPKGKQKAPVIVKDRLYHLRKYKDCFVARDFVQAVMTLGYCQTRPEAVEIGKILCRRGQMHHVVDEHDFRDGYYFFRWYADDLKVARTLSVRQNSLKGGRGSHGGSDGSDRNLSSRLSSSGSSRRKGSTEEATAAGQDIALLQQQQQRYSNLSTATLTIQSNDLESMNDFGDNSFNNVQNSSQSSSVKSRGASERSKATTTATAVASFGGLLDVGPLARRLRRNVKIRDRTYHGKVYKNCFLGKDAVSWLCSAGVCESREEAKVVGSAMITAGFFHHVVDDHVLKDLNLFYRFFEDEEYFSAAAAAAAAGGSVYGTSDSPRGKKMGRKSSKFSGTPKHANPANPGRENSLNSFSSDESLGSDVFSNNERKENVDTSMQFRLNTHTKVNSFVLGINDWTEDIEKRLSDGNKQVVKEALDSIRTRVCAIVNSREERMKCGEWSAPKARRQQGTLLGKVSRMLTEGQFEAVRTTGNIGLSPEQFASIFMDDGTAILSSADEKRKNILNLCQGNRSMLEKSFAGGTEICVLYAGECDNTKGETNDGETRHSFDTHVTRLLHRRTKMANPLLKTRDAVVIQDSFFIRKGLNGTESSDQPRDEDMSSYLESMQRHLDTLIATRDQHTLKLGKLKNNLKATVAMSATAPPESPQKVKLQQQQQDMVVSLSTLITMLNSEIKNYTMWISDPISAIQKGVCPPSIGTTTTFDKEGTDAAYNTFNSAQDAVGAQTILERNEVDQKKDLSHGIADGTFIVYEISVVHPSYPPGGLANKTVGGSGKKGNFGNSSSSSVKISSRHVRSEVLVSIYAVEPNNFGGMSDIVNSSSSDAIGLSGLFLDSSVNSGNESEETERDSDSNSRPKKCSVLTSIYQYDPVGLPQWMMRSIVDSPALQGRKSYPVGCTPPKRRTSDIALSSISHSIGSDDGTKDIFKQKGRKNNHEITNQPHPRLFDYDILAVLGRGGYGKVLLVREKNALKRDDTSNAPPSEGDDDNNVLYAMKVIRKAILTKTKQIERTKLERNIMARCKHPFVVQLKASFQTTGNLYLVMEFAQGGDLFTHLHRDGPFLENRVKVYAAEIILALEHLNTQGVIYRDLKPENVMLDRRGHVKIVDFGLARAFDGSKIAEFEAQEQSTKNPGSKFPSWKYQTNSFAGTERYMSPEQLLQKSYSFSVDWFQLGLTLAELLTRRHPFQGQNHYQTMKNIVDATYIPVLRVSKRMKPLSNEVVSFLDSLLQRNPSRRLGTIIPSTGHVDARNHAWFADIDWNVALASGLDAGFVPTVANNIDVSNFDDVFTQETAELSGEGNVNAPSLLNDNDNISGNSGSQNSSWINLWGLLGDGNDRKKDKKNGIVESGDGIRSSMIDGDNDDFDDFDGFSFEEPSRAADQVKLESLAKVIEEEEEEDGGEEKVVEL